MMVGQSLRWCRLGVRAGVPAGPTRRPNATAPDPRPPSGRQRRRSVRSNFPRRQHLRVPPARSQYRVGFRTADRAGGRWTRGAGSDYRTGFLVDQSLTVGHRATDAGDSGQVEQPRRIDHRRHDHRGGPGRQCGSEAWSDAAARLSAGSLPAGGSATGAVATVTCDPKRRPGRPPSATYLLLRDRPALDAAFVAAVRPTPW